MCAAEVPTGYQQQHVRNACAPNHHPLSHVVRSPSAALAAFDFVDAIASTNTLLLHTHACMHA